MPTPSDEEGVSSGVIPMLALDIAASMRGAFTSCPPEEGRSEQRVAPDGQEQADEEVEVPLGPETEEMAATGGAQSEGVEGADDASTLPAEGEGKTEGEDDASDRTTTHPEALEHSPSPTPSIPNSERDRDSDVRLAQSMATATISSSDADAAKNESPTARYLHFPENDRNRV